VGKKREIRQIGNSQGIILPKDILELYNMKIGDKLNLSPAEDHLILAKVDGKNVKNKKIKR